MRHPVKARGARPRGAVGDLGVYLAVYQLRLVGAVPGWLAVALAILGVALGFYAWHRLSHRVSLTPRKAHVHYYQPHAEESRRDQPLSL